MLGQQIRRVRLQRDLTATELAHRADVSRSLISQIERGRASPSVEVLCRIARTLEVQVGALFGESPQVPAPFLSASSGNGRCANGPSVARVVRRNERKVLSLPSSKVRYELLSPSLQGRLEFVRIEIGPGDASPAEGYSHEGEESLVMLSGKGRLQYGDQEHELEEGDAITFDSSVPHRLVNPSDRPIVAISAGTPPSF